MLALDLAARHRATPEASRRSGASRPAAPRPRLRRPGFFAAVRALRKNPITAFAEEAYQARVLDIGRWRPMLLVNDPDEIEHVLVGNAGNYRKSVQQQRRLKPALGDGLLTAEADGWRRARRIASPLFSPKAVAQLFDDMRGAAGAMRDRWLARNDPSAPLDMVTEFQRLAYEVVSRTVFSGALDQDRVRIHAAMAVYFDTLGRVDLATLLNLPSWVPSLDALRARRALTVFRSVVDHVVSGRAADPDRAASDLLDRLMGAPDPATGELMATATVADNVLTFLAAGHETTGNALAWILYLLALAPWAEEEVVAEIASVVGTGAVGRDELDRLVFTRAVVDEAVRLYPPAPFIGREAVSDDCVAGRAITSGTQVLISPWIVHRHRRLWDDPDDFRPERFMPSRGREIARGAFIPFGLGPRICIGQGFANQEILTALATILPVFRFRLADGAQVVPQARITLRPARGLPMIVSVRHP